MSSISLMRIAIRATSIRSTAVRTIAPRAISSVNPSKNFSTTTRIAADPAEDHGHQESFEDFCARYEKDFDQVQDVFELQRNLNNSFSYDLVPSPAVIIAALKAARRVNDYPTAVRIFEGIKAKVETKQQYEQYLEELKDLREDLGVDLKEDLYPEGS